MAGHFGRACVSVGAWEEKELPTRETRAKPFSGQLRTTCTQASKRRVGFGGANKRLGGRRGDDATAATRCLHFVSRSNFQDSDGDDAAGGDRVIITFVGCRPRVRRTTGSSRAISTCTKAAFVYFSHSLVPCQSHCILPFLKSHSRCPRGQGIEEEGYYRNKCLIQPPASFALSHTPTGEWRASEVFIH